MTTPSRPRIPRRAVNGILLFDKPRGFSSNDALQRVKRLFRAEKAGHTGNLDPLATGLLPICFGQATKLCGHLLDSDKRYLARVKPGEKTTTGDTEGEVIQRSDAGLLSREALEAVLPAFTGTIRQVPPMYSALKHQGQRLYELAREGVEVERQPREVAIHELRLTAFEPGGFELDVRCSKGTYIRTLAEDLAAALGQCAHLVALRRTEVAPFEGAIRTWEDLQAAA
ncbi:MAG: tRNA pseudouridine(55) synthase TruB, partial [Solimonas sp.]